MIPLHEINILNSSSFPFLLFKYFSFQFIRLYMFFHYSTGEARPSIFPLWIMQRKFRCQRSLVLDTKLMGDPRHKQLANSLRTYANQPRSMWGWREFGAMLLVWIRQMANLYLLDLNVFYSLIVIVDLSLYQFSLLALHSNFIKTYSCASTGVIELMWRTVDFVNPKTAGIFNFFTFSLFDHVFLGFNFRLSSPRKPPFENFSWRLKFVDRSFCTIREPTINMSSKNPFWWEFGNVV